MGVEPPSIDKLMNQVGCSGREEGTTDLPGTAAAREGGHEGFGVGDPEG